MKTETLPSALMGSEKQTSSTGALKNLENACENCRPLTPIACVTGCKIWKLKNQFRKLHQKMKDPKFMTNLLNTLKNKRRMQILEMISKGRCSVDNLQIQMKKSRYYHSQQTITAEYLIPLVEVGLAEEDENHYYATTFGCQLNELIKNFHDIEDNLPSHSECYEEIALGMLLNQPRGYEDFRNLIPAKSVARVISRLQGAGLIDTNKERDYIFYLKTKRDSNKAKFSPTERRIYENLPRDGASARKIAEKTGISLRRTYKYLKKLKGKKMVFSRKRPKSYSLTADGLKLALTLQEIHDLAAETLAAAAQLFKDEETLKLLVPSTYKMKNKKKERKTVPLTTIRRSD